MINVFVYFILHPTIKVVKTEVHSFDTVSDDDPLRAKFRRLHVVSAVLNLMLLADGVALLLIGVSKKTTAKDTCHT
jgi:hypothetical protein